MSEPKNIYCPKCSRKLGKWDGKSTINVICKCSNCNKRVVYHVDTGETQIKDRDPRKQSSGVNLSY